MPNISNNIEWNKRCPRYCSVEQCDCERSATPSDWLVQYEALRREGKLEEVLELERAQQRVLNAKAGEKGGIEFWRLLPAIACLGLALFLFNSHNTYSCDRRCGTTHGAGLTALVIGLFWLYSFCESLRQRFIRP
jgi:hypothetical protein